MGSNDELRTAINPVVVELHRMVQNDVEWPPGLLVGQVDNTVKRGHPKIIGMAMVRAIDRARRDTTGEVLNDGYMQTFGAFERSIELLKKRCADKAIASGTEAKQRRGRELRDHEQLALMENILSCAFAKHQHSLLGAKSSACRKPCDTLSLGLVVALHFAMGQRCVNVRRPPYRFSLFLSYNHVCVLVAARRPKMGLL